MDISSLSISLPICLTLVGTAIAVATYFGNRKRQTKADTKEEVKEKTELETKLVAMEKDIQYIRVMVDKIDKKYDNHETRIQVLEHECQRRKS